ncbi:MAG: hypothetical protein H6643_12495 [Caldilineaceae bacterium]|nr:hypothetical protein [Caldilineaceae bacterium]
MTDEVQIYCAPSTREIDDATEGNAGVRYDDPEARRHANRYAVLRVRQWMAVSPIAVLPAK